MKKILFGAILGAVAMYFLDPERGENRRQTITGLWHERKDTVLDAARTTAGAVSGISNEVSGVVGGGLERGRAQEGAATNGSPLGSGAPAEGGKA
jgi:gas vesicle protein